MPFTATTSEGSKGQGPAPDDDLVYCANCTELVGPVHIHCDACTEVTVQLCLQCFSCGAECGPHLNSHPYHVINTGGVSLFNGASHSSATIPLETDEQSTSYGAAANLVSLGGSGAWLHPWSSSEEATLLDMVERYNLGNWQDITKVVNPRRTAQEVKEHYDQYYLRGRIGQATVPKLFNRRPKVKDHTEPLTVHRVPSGVGVMSPPIRSTVCKLNLDDLRLLAYMPKRDDFEKEWNNDAEAQISGLLLMPDDDDLDKAVKLALVDMYIREVAKRRKRKALARDYELVPKFFKQEKPIATGKYFRNTPAERVQLKNERDTKEKLKKITQYMPSGEFQTLIDGLMKEKLLKERIEELQKLRKNGITTLEGKRKFDLDTPRKAKRRKKRLSFNPRDGKALSRWNRVRRWQKKLAEQG